MNEAKFQPAVEKIVKEIYDKYPDLLTRYGERGVERTKEDNMHHFKHLETAYMLRNFEIMTQYAVWLNGILTSRGMSTSLLIDNFNMIRAVIPSMETWEKEERAFYLEAVEQAISVLQKQ
ncbi:hypothetical protein [Paenibacillus gansuensis]|uniref:Uncharacterized protein n=1 Tax=Paenibacillus gansuensis TaxID=306542 RepID=A0ABW5PDC6_9BACL